MKNPYSKNKHCKCGKLITNNSKLCQQCFGITLRKTKKKFFCKVCKKKISKDSILGYCTSCSNKFAHKRGIQKHYCITCKTEEISLTNYLYGKRHCIKCSIKILTGKGNGMYGKKRPDLVKRNKLNRKHPMNFCPDCGKEIQHGYKRCREHSYIAQRGQKRPKQSLAMTGKKNHFYIHGEGKFPYPMKFNKKLKEQIRKRDDYKCQICGKKGNHVHHIDYDKNNCNPNNLITLCHDHHMKTNFNRDYWFSYFTYIMENFK